MSTHTPSYQANRTVYQLLVTLLNGEPPMPYIWRRIQVESGVSLLRLHRILQAVMGWTNSHLHQFILEGKDGKDRRCYGVPDPEFDEELGKAGMKTINERGVKLNRLVSDVGSKFLYEYDFGDGWTHEVVVEKTLPIEEGKDYPACLGGGGACPPEDVGGIGGYVEFLEVIADPRHSEHRTMLRWAGVRAGGRFDPRAFGLDAVNRKLRRLR